RILSDVQPLLNRLILLSSAAWGLANHCNPHRCSSSSAVQRGKTDHDVPSDLPAAPDETSKARSLLLMLTRTIVSRSSCSAGAADWLLRERYAPTISRSAANRRSTSAGVL